MKIIKDLQKIIKLKYQVLRYQPNNKIIKVKINEVPIMKDENIYNLWTEFINDNKYSFLFSINKI